MDRKYRKPVIAGNWKMNMLPSMVAPFGKRLKALAGFSDWCETVVCVPFVMLTHAIDVFSDCRISVGAQNVGERESGALTGEVSAAQLADLGVKYVIVGHSERRTLFGEDNITVNKKIRLALNAGLNPIVCVGETAEERDMDAALDIVRLQVKYALNGLDIKSLGRVTLAYEPVWAIGTGRNATAEQAGEVCSYIRSVVGELFDAPGARAMTVLYGGSVNAENAAELFSRADVDGGLVGGASLDPDVFYSVIKAADQ
ncbi:MAG: triose-phosphate isomerase [Clostridiales bacterium]|nr:triose-phosphate isomerase [Clostridiales bacterium]